MNESERNGRLLRDYAIAVVVAIVVALAIRSFLFEAYRIPSSAMKPTLEAGDTIFVSKSAYGIRLPDWSFWPGKQLRNARVPDRGDVVIFSVAAEPGRDFIKRVIGLPGEVVAIRQNRIEVNGHPFSNTGAIDFPCGTETLPDGHRYGTCWEPPAIENFGPETIPANSVFVLGDLRSSATEQGKTQAWRIVPTHALKGKAIWVWLSIEPGSFDQTGIFPRFRFHRMFRRIE